MATASVAAAVVVVVVVVVVIVVVVVVVVIIVMMFDYMNFVRVKLFIDEDKIREVNNCIYGCKINIYNSAVDE